MIEDVVDSHEGRQTHTAGLPFPSDPYVCCPPRIGAGAQRITHEIPRRVALLHLSPRAAKRGRLGPHREIQPVLRYAGQRAAVERTEDRTSHERIAPIAIISIGP